jgi:methyl-accepting chemotaxis protein
MISRLRISSKLLVLVGAMLVAMLFIGGYGMRTVLVGQARAERDLSHNQAVADAVAASRAAEVAFKTQVQEWKNILLRGQDPADYDRYLAAFRQRSELFDRDLDAVDRALVQLGLPREDLQQARELHARLGREYAETLERVPLRGSDNGRAADAAVRGKDRPVDLVLERIVGTLQEFARKENEQAVAAASAASRQAIWWMGGVMLAVLVSGLGFGLWVARGITRPLAEAVHASRRVAAGDLTVQLRTEGRDEVAQLLAAMSEMSTRLRAVLGEVVSAAHAVADSSSQISQGNLDLSQRTEEQAASLEETASQMEELTTTVAQNAEHARSASRMAATAAEVAGRGGVVVGEVVGTMHGISDAARRIGDIVGVIDGIAFQTNILALNAAVEAARAGEQGRGFAVVAAEVRNLAQRSASAAREIKQLIGESVGRVETGARLVGEAGQTMEEIVDAARRVSELIAEMAAASQEQTAGIEQVNTAITQMDQVVQQNASLVEEATAATESMKSQAQGLLQLVSRFRLDESGADQARREGETSQARIPPMRQAPGRATRRGPRPALAIESDWKAF